MKRYSIVLNLLVISFISVNMVFGVGWQQEYEAVIDDEVVSGAYWGGANMTKPAPVDIDADGDFDMFIGGYEGGIFHYRNDGTPDSPSWTFVGYTPAVVDGGDSTPTFVDIDGDDDFDMFIGEGDGNITFYRNDGDATSPIWTFVTEKYEAIDVGGSSVPTFVDIDADGDYDMFIGKGDGNITFYRNDGDATSPIWTLVTENYNSINVGKISIPTFADIDADDDYDIFVGGGSGYSTFHYYRNDGDATSPSWTFVTEHYNDIFSSSALSPTFVDIDGDEDYDLFVGHHWGHIMFYRNDGTPDSAIWEFVVDDYFPIDLRGYTAPAFTDIDSDSNLDMFIGQVHGGVFYYWNDGAPDAPSWKHLGTIVGLGGGGRNHPHAFPAFVDIDSDGDYDLFIGEVFVWEEPNAGGNINFYRNDGTPESPDFTLVTEEYEFIDVGSRSTPTFADIDADGDFDLFIGEEDGNINFYQNDGTLESPAWTLVTENYAGIDVGEKSAPAFYDVDDDGDLDLFIGEGKGHIVFYRNDGDRNFPVWTFVTANYNWIDVGRNSMPTFADIDGDGDKDLFIGEEDGGINFYWNLDYIPPPQVMAFSPMPGDIVPVDAKIAAVFSEPMDESTLNESTVLVEGSFSGPITGSIIYDESTRTVTFVPDALFMWGERVTVTITGDVTDLGGAGLDGDRDGAAEGSPEDDFVWSFIAGEEGFGSISGVVTADADGSPIEGIRVLVWKFMEVGSISPMHAGEAITGPDGKYTISSLKVGSYIVRADAAGTEFISEYFDDVLERSDATLVEVRTGEETSGIDFGLAEGGSISGMVETDADGSPIEGIWVIAEDAGKTVGSVQSQSDGSYIITALPTGSYLVRVDTTGTDFVREYFDDAMTPDDATSVDVTAGSETTDIDFGLALGGSISGRVTADADGSPITTVTVRAEDFSTGLGLGKTSPQPDGSYKIKGLPEGDYRVSVDTKGTHFTKEWFDDVKNPEDATPVSVVSGEDTPDIDFGLEAPGTISGVVTTDVGNAPITNVAIFSENLDTGDEYNTTSDEDGNYEMDLPEGSYRVRAEFGAEGQLIIMEYFDDVTNPEDATPVRVTMGDETSDIDFELALSEMGYILQWLTLGPLKNTGDSTDAIADDFLESICGEANVIPAAGEFFEWEEETLTWEEHPMAIGLVFDQLYGWETDYATAYIAIYLRFAMTEDIDLWLGSDDSISVWLNGENVWLNPVNRPWKPDEDRIKVTVQEGWNRMLVKVSETREGWGVSVRFPDIMPVEISTTPVGVALFPNKSWVGSTVTTKGRGYQPDEEIRIDFGETSGIVTTFADGDGNFSVDFVVDEQPLGKHPVKAVGLSSGIVTTAIFTIIEMPMFSDVTDFAGVGDGHQGGTSPAFGDYDGDGNLDIFIPDGNILYRNNDDGTFTNVSSEAGLPPLYYGHGAAFGDYDNDGDLDIYVSRGGPNANTLYSNNGDGTFTDVTDFAGVGDAGPGWGIAFGDYNNDGNLDIYVANNCGANVLYKNNGDGTFSDVSAEAGVDNPGCSAGTAFGDYDGDGDLDIYVGGRESDSALYRNNSDGTFTDVTDSAGVPGTQNAHGVMFGDYNNDGKIDLFIADASEGPNALYRNEGDGTFTDVTVEAGLGITDFSQSGAAFGDYDNDGNLDIYVTSREDKPNMLYRSNGDGTFTDIAPIAGVADERHAEGVAFGDYDGDGDLDLYVVTIADRNILYRNNGNENNWLHVKTIGAISNRDGIGARVKVVSGDLPQIREVSGGSGLGSQDSLPVEFGLGSYAQADIVEIRWPSGIVQTLTDVETNQVITIIEDGTPHYGDVSLNGEVTAHDASLVLRYVVGLIQLSLIQRINADVTDDGTISGLDAAMILQHSVGLIEKFPAEGEVSPTIADISNRTFALNVADVIAKVGQRVTVPISLNDGNDVFAGKFELAYDSELLKVIDVSAGEQTAKYSLVHNALPDRVNISFAGSESLKEGGVIVNVTFEVLSNMTPDAIIPLVLADAIINENSRVTIKHGSIAFSPTQTALHQNYPNPFNPDTWIPYQLAEDTSVTISIYNIRGQLVRKLRFGEKQAGYYVDRSKAAYWNGRNDLGEWVASGVYFYTLRAGKFAKTRRMLILK